jgi:hypothetical protein
MPPSREVPAPFGAPVCLRAANSRQRFSGMRFGGEGGKIAAAMAAYPGKLLSYSQSLARQIDDVTLQSFFRHHQD